MYHPYFRGKQFELITLRENAALIAGSGFIPIIEPVKKSLSGLTRALQAMKDVNGEVILVANPEHGDHTDDTSLLDALLLDSAQEFPNVTIGISLRAEHTIEDLFQVAQIHRGRRIALIHAGFPDSRAILGMLDAAHIDVSACANIFLEEYCSTLYRRHFKSEKSNRRVLLRDGFQIRPNRTHPPVEPFSDLHVTFQEQGMTGFGDFLVVGDDYAEGGGPAYVVAIHLTFIDPDRDDEMFVHHFKSTRSDTPKDPGGKFLEALTKLRDDVLSPTSKVERTASVEEFLSLFDSKHFPGLGYVKKLSMAHHIETLARYFARSM